jgi:hypothetical protein
MATLGLMGLFYLLWIRQSRPVHFEKNERAKLKTRKNIKDSYCVVSSATARVGLTGSTMITTGVVTIIMDGCRRCYRIVLVLAVKEN